MPAILRDATVMRDGVPNEDEGLSRRRRRYPAIHQSTGRHMDLEREIEAAAAKHAEGLRELWRLARSVKRDEGLGADEKARLLTAAYAPLSTKDIRQDFVMDGNAYEIGVSFRSSINKLIRVKSALRAHGYRIAPGGNSKTSDRSFARALGVPVPRTLAEDVPLQAITPTPNTILKPVRGSASKAVFFVDPSLSLQSIRTGTVYDSMAGAATEIDRYRSAVSADSWIQEEAVLDAEGRPAPDLKLYMFYGVMGLSLEIRRAHGPNGEDLYSAHNGEGEAIEIGPSYRHFQGAAVPTDAISKARAVSLASPVPFLRIDFHLGRDECYLGEITPHPGGVYAGELHESVDRYLGRMFLDAEARLYIDMLNGKGFQAYLDHYEVTAGPPRSRSDVRTKVLDGSRPGRRLRMSRRRRA